MNKYHFYYENDFGDVYPAERKEAEPSEMNDIAGPYYLCADVDAAIRMLMARIAELQARVAAPVVADEEVTRRFAAAFAKAYDGYWDHQDTRARAELTLRIALQAINKEDPPQDTRIYPYMECPDVSHQLDPLEGCRACGSTGYHNSVPNPRWEQRVDNGRTPANLAHENGLFADIKQPDETMKRLSEIKPMMPCPNSVVSLGVFGVCDICGESEVHADVKNPQWDAFVSRHSSEAVKKDREAAEKITDPAVTLAAAIKEYQSAREEWEAYEISQARIHAKNNMTREEKVANTSLDPDLHAFHQRGDKKP